ncbi:MAG: hypothetical protein WCR60_03050 [Patescibacteria group bacterium]
MKKNKKKIIVITLLVLILIAIAIAKQRAKKVIMPGPSPTPKFEEFATIKDGYSKDQPVLNEEDTEQLRLVTELKNISPVKTPNFSIEFSYKTGGFIIKSDLGLNATENALKIWLNENGFSAIKSERFEYQSNKLSL